MQQARPESQSGLPHPASKRLETRGVKDGGAGSRTFKVSRQKLNRFEGLSVPPRDTEKVLRPVSSHAAMAKCSPSSALTIVASSSISTHVVVVLASGSQRPRRNASTGRLVRGATVVALADGRSRELELNRRLTLQPCHAIKTHLTEN